MTDNNEHRTQKQRNDAARDARLAQNLRDNLRRRKAATRKATLNAPVTDAPESS